MGCRVDLRRWECMYSEFRLDVELDKNRKIPEDKIKIVLTTIHNVKTIIVSTYTRNGHNKKKSIQIE